LAPVEQGKRLKKLTVQILSAARSIGRKYHYDESHAEGVRHLSVRLFDELKTEQRMTDTHRLYPARISHQLSTAEADPGMSTALRSAGFLDVLSSTPAESSRRAPCIHARLRLLATKPGEKCGLEVAALIGQNVSDLAMGRLALASRSDYFAEIFGKQIILREAARPQ
jgi:hypothetical protein